MLFDKRKTKKIPVGFTAEDIKIEASTCTGERTIGFYSSKEGKLKYSELVRNDRDIDSFYEKYGLKRERAL